MGTVQKLFELRPDDISYATTPDNKRVRARVKLMRDGCPAEVHAEADDPISAVNAAIDKALNRYFDWSGTLVYQDVVRYGRGSTYAYTRLYVSKRGIQGISSNPDAIKALALSYIAAINEVIGISTPA